MNEDSDIERALSQYRTDPSPAVKRTVLSRFACTFHLERRGRFWRRRVPLYVVAAQIFIAVGLGFLAGRRSTGGEGHLEAVPTAVEKESAVTVVEIGPEMAPGDVL